MIIPRTNNYNLDRVFTCENCGAIIEMIIVAFPQKEKIKHLESCPYCGTLLICNGVVP